jgi:hypothetical protein
MIPKQMSLQRACSKLTDTRVLGSHSGYTHLTAALSTGWGVVALTVGPLALISLNF